MDSGEAKKKIGKKLRKLRMDAGFGSYSDFAFFYDLNKITVLRAEQGKNITIDTLIILLQIHNISLKEFFKDFK